MKDDDILQIVIPLDLIKNQDIYVIGSCVSVVEHLKIVGLIINVSNSTRELRNTIFDALLLDGEIELIIPINGYTHLRVNHMTMAGRCIVWGKNFSGN